LPSPAVRTAPDPGGTVGDVTPSEALDPAHPAYAEWCRDPFPVWQQLRHHEPLFHNAATRSWLLTRYHDVVAVFEDPDTYSNRVYEASLGKVFGPTMLQMDGREHVVRRTIIAPEVVGKRLDGYRTLIERNAVKLIDRFRADGAVDIVQQFSTWLPVNVICDMLGLPDDDLPFFHDCYQAMMVGLGQDPSLRRKGVEAAQAFSAYCAPIVEQRRRDPGTDFISRILSSTVDGEQLSDDEVRAFLALLLTAGGETTDKAIANMWANLLSDREQLDIVADDPAAFDPAFSETMRHSFPVISQVRLTTTDVEWYGTTVPAGSVMQVSLGSANNDETCFAEPRRFDLRRDDLYLSKELRKGFDDGERFGHLGFGLGKHFCLGYEMARVEAVIGSQLLLEACPGLRLADDAETRQVITGQTRSLASLPAIF
jgi:cytochrome P450